MQRNRLLIVLSFAGIALLLTLLVAVGPVSGFEVLVAGAACGAFFVALVAGVTGFGSGPQRTRGAFRFDGILVFGFLLGIALSIVLGIAAGVAVLDQADDEPTDSSEQYETSAAR